MLFRTLRTNAILCSLSFVFVQAFASEPDHTLLTQLSDTKQWRHLLHYHRVGVFSQDISQIDDAEFFLSPEGSHETLEELKATIAAFTSDEREKYACLYPARYHWIGRRLPTLELPQISCPSFEKFREEISARDLTLIFPAAYLNSPSSMFGHTLMRIDSGASRSELLSYSINYAANADPDDNELVFSYKGLTGGYPGVFSVLPYHEKVNEYNYLEARDVWEYNLDITQEELDQFVRHVWEIKDTHFDYYFFTENCSYHLLTLLDAASERFDLSRQFSSDVIPADTVRVLNDAGLIQDARFRPSMQTRLDHRLRHSADQTQDFAVTLVESQGRGVDALVAASDLSPREQAQSLELAVALARYRAKKDAERAKYYNRRTISLLSRRSKFQIDPVFDETPTPAVRDDQGHRSHRWMVRAGHNARGNYLGLDLRMSYHDFLDPSAGYLDGAQLEIINLKLKYYADDESAEIDEFRAIDIASLSPRNEFIKPISWFVSTGLQRLLYQRDELTPYLNAGPGLTYQIAKSDESSLISSVLLSTRVLADSDYSKGHVFESGPRVALIFQETTANIYLNWSRHYKLTGATLKHNDTAFGVATNINKTQSLRLGVRYQETLDEWGNTLYDLSGELAWGLYF